MSRSERLLALLQVLRRHRRAVTGAALAHELGISLRTLYRDIATLQAQGARVDGAPGLGYLLRPGFLLPPLMFSNDELEALVLGARWVARHGDAALAVAATDALAKIAAVLPTDRRRELDDSGLLVGPSAAAPGGGGPTVAVRQAIRAEEKLEIDYRDTDGRCSSRTVWPIAIGFFDHARVVVAWCELRQALRHFRADRIAAVRPTGERFAGRRQALMAEWRREQGLPDDPPAARAAADGN